MLQPLLDEQIWQENSALEFSMYDVKLQTKTAYGASGLFVGIKVFDSKVFYNPGREIYLNPSIELYISPYEFKTLSTHCVQIRSDIMGATETYFGADFASMSYKWAKTYIPSSIKIQVNGGFNNGKTESVVGEYYIPYSSLGLDKKPEQKIGIFPCYNHVISTSVSSGRQWCTGEGNYTVPGSYYVFDENGYVEKGNENHILGNGYDGLARSSGWGFSGTDTVESVAGGRQTIYFKELTGSRFLIEGELSYKSSLETSDFKGIDALPKAGILFGSEKTNRLSFLVDYATNDASRRNKMSFLIQAPGWNMSPYYEAPLNPLDNTPVFTDSHTDKIKLSIVKENKIIHCFVNDVYFMSKECIELSDSMNVGFITMGCGIEFANCGFTQNEEEIKTYLSEKGLCNITVQQPAFGGFVSSDKISIQNGKAINLTVDTANGYMLESLNIDGIDRKADIVNGGLRIDNVTKDLLVVPVFKEIEGAVNVGGIVSINNESGRNAFVTAKNTEKGYLFYKIIPNRAGAFTFKLSKGEYEFQAYYNEFAGEKYTLQVENDIENLDLKISTDILVLGDSTCGLPMSGEWDIEYGNASHTLNTVKPINNLANNKLYVKYKEDTHYIYSVTMNYDKVDPSDPAPKAGIIMAGKEGVRLTFMVDYTSVSAHQYKILNDLPKWDMQPSYTINNNINVASTRYTVVRDNTNLYVFVGKECIYRGTFVSLDGIKTTGGVYVLGCYPVYKDFEFTNGKDAVREFLYHTVTVNTSVNGYVSADKEYTEDGEGVEFTVKAEPSYALSSIKINGVEYIDKMVLGKLVIESVVEDLVVDAAFMRTTLKTGKIIIAEGFNIDFNDVFICYGDVMVNPDVNGDFSINVPRNCTKVFVYSDKFRNIEKDSIEFSTLDSNIGEFIINCYKLIPYSGCELEIYSNSYTVRTNEGISFALLSGYELTDYSFKVTVKANSNKAGLILKNNDHSFSYALFGKGEKGLDIVEFHNKLQYGICDSLTPVNADAFVNIESGLNIEVLRKGRDFYVFVDGVYQFSFTSVQTTIFTPAKIGFITTGEAVYSNISISEDNQYIDSKVENIKTLLTKDIYTSQQQSVTDLLGNVKEQNSFMVLGDSNLDWWNSDVISRSEETIQRDFSFTDCKVENIGVAGSVIENFLVNIDTIIALKPRAIMIAVGGNDCAIRNGLEMSALLVELTERLAKGLPETKIFLTTIRHSGYRIADAQQITLANSITKQYFEDNKYSNLTIIDCEKLFFDPDAATNDSSYFQGDKLHLTPKAYKKWLTVLKPVIVQNLGEKYLLNINYNDGGVAVCDKLDLFSWGTAAIKIRPNQGYEIKSITVNGISYDIAGDFNLACQKETMNVEIVFEKITRQQYTVSGSVYGGNNGSYLVNNGAQGEITNGIFSFELPSGSYSVIFNINGYLSCEKVFEIIDADIDLGILENLQPMMKAITGTMESQNGEIALTPINNEGYAVFEGISTDKFVIETKVKGIDISSVFGFTVINSKIGNIEYKGFIGCQIENSRIATLNNTYVNGSSCWDNSGDFARFDTRLSLNGVKIKLVRNQDKLYLFINDDFVGESSVSKEFTTSKNPAYNLTGDMEACFGIYSRTKVTFYDISFSIAQSDVQKEIDKINI